MKIPKKFLEKFATPKKLEKYDTDSKEWVSVDFDPNNEEHVKMRELHIAEVEILCVSEAMNLEVEMEREIN
tara:strand:+ start:567 stop:779 length:213 start_codon:yes stop_codon:yes gene_type:complete